MIDTKSHLRILVLLSTYNGEKWLQEQIESILSQKDVCVNILIRDDGSTDNTLQVISRFEKKVSKLDNQMHLGFNKSYLSLMSESIKYNYDYIAFSDQDDVWDENKLIHAINIMNSTNKMHYSSRRSVYSINNKQETKYIFPKRAVKALKYNFLVENVAPGCTTVLSRGFFLKEVVSRLNSMQIDYDYFIYMIAAITDNCHFDSDSKIRYRLHDKNAVGIRVRRQKSVTAIIHQLRTRKDQASVLLGTFNDLPQNWELLARFLSSNSIFHKILFLVRCGQLRQSKFENFSTKLLLLLI